MACCVSGVKNIARKLPVNSGFRASSLVFKFPESLNKLHCHLNAPQIGKTIFKGFSYFPPASYLLSPQNGNVGDFV